MAHASHPQDPYFWDVERLIQELTAEKTPCISAQPSKRPDASALARALRQHEVDGETLLGWEDLFKSLEGLFADLGVVKLPHKMTLARTIAYLKKHSPGYRNAKAQLERDEDLEAPDGSRDVHMQNGLTHGHHDDIAKRDSADSARQSSAKSPGASVLPVRRQSSFEDMSTRDLAAGSNGSTASPVKDPAAKKRRLVPELVSTDATRGHRPAIPTAADGLSFAAATLPTPWQPQSETAYLGHGRLVLSDLIPRTSLVLNHPVHPADNSREFSQARNHIPPGRRLQVSRGLRRLLRSNGEAEASIKSGFATFVGRSPSPESEILPLFGESDSEGYDSETLREMREDEVEISNVPNTLSRDRVATIVQTISDEISQKWTEKKLPRWQRKGNAMWNQACRRGRDKELVIAMKQLADLDGRIGKLRAHIQREDWPNEAQLRRQALSLEASIEDRMYQTWLINLLRGREPPKPPPTIRAPSRRRDKISEAVELPDGEGELIILSESDLSDDDFVVPEPMDVLPDNGDREQTVSVTQCDHMQAEKESPFSSPTVIDLTMDLDSPSQEEQRSESKRSDMVDLLTPQNPLHRKIIRLTTSPPNPTHRTLTPEQLQIPFDRPQDIAEISVETWQAHKDPRRLTISYLWRKCIHWRDQLFEIVKTQDSDEIWHSIISPSLEQTTSPAASSSPSDNIAELNVFFARLFWQYAFCKTRNPLFSKYLGNRLRSDVASRRNSFDDFCGFLRRDVVPHFPPAATAQESEPEHTPDSAMSEDEDVDGDDDEDDDAHAENIAKGATPSKKRKRHVARDKAAQELRDLTHIQAEQFHKGKKALAKRMARASISDAESRLILNVSEASKDNGSLICVSGFIASRIKDHQIDGVRFMWDQIMAGQGCLLAHTMGLGKTMQIITLLVAIVEACSSQDPAVRSQIPLDLHTPRTLILCPSGLVENWMEELRRWSPPDVFSTDANGNCLYVDSQTSSHIRFQRVKAWGDAGGVLVVGYEMFKKLTDDEDLASILTERPTIVVADEAHRLKNSKSQLHQIGSRFSTMRRLALTGSPLANNVVEFYHMIDWATPNYLGPLKEFNAVYVEPIQTGLYGDSTNSEFRKAKKRLAALEKTVSPKTHRLTIKSLKGELPEKKEFIVKVPLTPIQRRLYEAVIRSVRDRGIAEGHMLSVLNFLTLLCNHPRCFHMKLLEERGKRDEGPASRSGSAEDDSSGIAGIFMSQCLKILNQERDLSRIDLSWKVKHLVAILDECRRQGDRVLIFSQSIPTMDYLQSLFRQQGRSLSRLDGLTPASQRQTMVHEFNKDASTLEIFLISTTAGGVGLNIAGANRVVIFDFKFNPVTDQQAVGRAFRIGQKKPVFVYRFVQGGTFEQSLHNKAIFKTQLSSRVVDKQNPKRWSKKLNDFIKDPVEPEQEPLDSSRGKDPVLDVLLSSTDHQRGIRSIVTTDTFEEEDPNDVVLSAEERKEVESMYQMNLVRNKDPEEFRRLERELSRAQEIQQSQALKLPSYHVSHPTPVNNPYASQIQGMMAAEAGGQRAHAPNASASQPPAAPVSAENRGISANGTRQVSTHLTSQMPLAPPGRVQQPMTLSGANTRFDSTSGATTSSQAPPTIPSTPLAGTGQGEQPLDLVKSFERQLITAATSNGERAHLLPNPDSFNSLTKELATSIQLQRRGHGSLPNISHWKMLKELAGNSNFAVAVLAGYLTAETLADESQMNRARELSRDAAPNEYWNALEKGLRHDKDPHHLQRALKRSNGHGLGDGQPTSRPRPNARAKEDLLALREVADRRKHRPPKLPSWANRAVEDGQW